MYGAGAMQPAIFSTRANPFGGSGLSRLISTLLSLVMLALFLWMMIEMGLVSMGTSGADKRLTAVPLTASSGAVHKSAKARTSSSHQTSQPQPQPQEAQPKPARILWLTHYEFAAADISRLPRHEADPGDTSSQNSGSTYGPGEGPGGAQLFNAAWYREPTHAELVTYLPGRVDPGSWATIACRTVANFHVEDCQELDESPPGSGLARALRRASWQFLVRPPRVNGVAKLGGWVRIRFDFTRPDAG